jgi:hypothetical protein
MGVHTIIATAGATVRDAAILATVRQGAGGRRHNLANRRALKEKAAYLANFEHFRRLCLADLRQAFHEDRQEGTRSVKYRRLAWTTLFGHFADYHRIGKALRIQALDRQGNYACELIDSQHEEEDDWEEFVALAKQFGIRRHDLLALRKKGEA